MNRKSKIREMRKSIMRVGKVTRTELLNRDNDGKLYPKKQQGYAIEVEINGYKICAYGNNEYDAWKGAMACKEVALERPHFETTIEVLPNGY